MAAVTININYDRNDHAVIVGHESSTGITHVRIQQGQVHSQSQKRKAIDDGADHDELKSVVTINVQRSERNATSNQAPQAKRARPEGRPPKLVPKAVKPSPETVALKPRKTIRDVHQVAIRRAEAAIRHRDPSNGKVCFRTYGKETTIFIKDINWLLARAIDLHTTDWGADAMARADDLMSLLISELVNYEHRYRQCHKAADCDDCLRGIECGEKGWCLEKDTVDEKRAMNLRTSGLDLGALDQLDETLCSVLKTMLKYYPKQPSTVIEYVGFKDWMAWYRDELVKIGDCLQLALDDPPQVFSKSWELVKNADLIEDSDEDSASSS